MAALWVVSAHAEIYTGMAATGVRWFSDVPPGDDTQYRALAIMAPPLTASPPASSPPTSSPPTVPPSAATSTSPAPVTSTAKPVSSPSASARSSVTHLHARQTEDARLRAQERLRLQRDARAQQRLRAQERRQAQERARQGRCQGYAEALRKIRAQRVAGYTASQDRPLRQRRRLLQEKQFAECGGVKVW